MNHSYNTFIKMNQVRAIRGTETNDSICSDYTTMRKVEKMFLKLSKKYKKELNEHYLKSDQQFIQARILKLTRKRLDKNLEYLLTGTFESLLKACRGIISQKL